MIKTLRVRIITALLLAAMLTAFAASPILTNVTGLGGTASAEDCAGSSC